MIYPEQDNLIKHLLTGMIKIRTVEETIARIYHEQEMRCPVHLCTGQEAVAAGVCGVLDRSDTVMSTHRSHGHYIAKGGDLKRMMAEIYGKETGCCRGKGGSMHLVDLDAGFQGAVPIVGSTLAIAAGAAFASLYLGDQRISVVFFGDGATEEGVFHETLNAAALYGLPLMFVCENNYYSVYSPLSVRQPDRGHVVERVRGYGIPAVHADGNDVMAVYSAAKDAADHIRRGKGPYFLSFNTYRWREHCGPNFDNDLGYRMPEEFEAWKIRCPIEKAKTRCIENNVLTEKELADLEHKIETDVLDAVSFAKNSSFPDKSEADNHVYA